MIWMILAERRQNAAMTKINKTKINYSSSTTHRNAMILICDASLL
jgi:hypothetical protein